MFALAGEMKGLRRFVHISTAYVAGTRSGIVMEEPAVASVGADGAFAGQPGAKIESSGTAFSSPYEQSKAEAEEIVRSSGLPFAIVRPGMIVGDSKTGWARSFNTIYYVLKMMLLGKMRVLPIRQDAPLNIVPDDYVADCVMKLSFAEEAEDRTFHLTCPAEAAPTAGRLLEFACRRNFMRQGGQTVFEQAQVRRESRRYPIHYYDVSADGIRRITGPEANKRIVRIQSALYNRGIRKGDRVAITGITENADTARLVFYLYRNLQIAMEGQIPGEIHVADCYFSRMYSPMQCAVMSLVDSGIIAGLCGGRETQVYGKDH